MAPFPAIRGMIGMLRAAVETLCLMTALLAFLFLLIEIFG